MSENDDLYLRGRDRSHKTIRRLRRKELEAEKPDKKYINYIPRLPEGYEEEHERRIAAERDRVERETAQLGQTPEGYEEEYELCRQAKEVQRRQRRRLLLVYLAAHGGAASPTIVRETFNWSRNTYFEAAAGEWFERDWQGVRLTEAGWAAAKKEATK